MPTPTYDLLASSVLGSNTATVTFSSIPSSYQDLVLVIKGSSTALAFGKVIANNDFSTYRYVLGNNYNNNTYSEAAGQEGFAFMTSSYSNTGKPTLVIMNILDYSKTNKFKTALTRTNTTDPGQTSPIKTGSVEMSASIWASTSAITSLAIYATGGSWESGSSFYLYGIAG